MGKWPTWKLTLGLLKHQQSHKNNADGNLQEVVMISASPNHIYFLFVCIHAASYIFVYVSISSAKSTYARTWIINPKIWGCYLVTFFYRTPIFNWSVVRWGSKNKHYNDQCSNGIELCFQISLTTPHLIMNIIGITYVFNQGIINKHAALPITITTIWKFEFQAEFCWCFIIDLLMQHKFLQCVNLTGRRSWRTWETNWMSIT